MRPAIALFASSRRHGNTGRLLDEITQRLAIDVVDLSEKKISPFDYEHRNRGDDFEPLLRRVLTYDQIIFASPVYWYAVSPPMKIFIDRISDVLDLPELHELGRRLRTKCTYVLCTSEDEVVHPSFLGAFRDTFEYLGMQFGGYIHASCPDGYVQGSCERDVAAFVERIKGHDPHAPV